MLNGLHAARQRRDVPYWRITSGHAVDIDVTSTRNTPTAIECLWSQDAVDQAAMLAA